MLHTSVGMDITNLGASRFPRSYTAIPEIKFDAIVEDVLVNEVGSINKTLSYNSDGSNVGEIRYRVISTNGSNDRNVNIEDLPRALPTNVHFVVLPLIGERVVIHMSPGEQTNAFYSAPLNTSNKVTDSVSVVMTAVARPSDPAAAVQNRQIENIQVTQPAAAPAEIETFMSQVRTRHLRATPGDVMLQGRFGNTIRLGSSLFMPETQLTPISPNILLTAGQWETPKEISTVQETPYSAYFENINNDKSSIWMVSDQYVPFMAATAHSESKPGRKAHLRSAEVRTQEYTGAQIFINSDRVIINSKKNEISLFSNTEINLSAMKSVTVDTESSIFLHANRNVKITANQNIVLAGKKIDIISSTDLSYKTDGNYTITGNKIFIGRHADTSQPLVLGATLSLWLQALLTLLLTPGAVLTTSGPASINPALLPAFSELKRQLGVTPQQAIFNSRDNFTSELNK
jgi:hypothetical protein